MTGLGPVIHGSASKPLLDGRIKSGHDEDRWIKMHLQRQADGGDGLRGDALAAAGEAEASVVVALTLTRSAATPRIAATRSTIAAR